MQVLLPAHMVPFSRFNQSNENLQFIHKPLSSLLLNCGETFSVEQSLACFTSLITGQNKLLMMSTGTTLIV